MEKDLKPRHLVALLAALGLVSTAVHAATDTGTATANIITPITITNTTDLDFGDLSAGATGGTVVMAAAGTRTSTGDVTLVATNAGAAGSFDVNGQANATYAITLPTSVTLSDGTNNMSVDSFQTDATGTLDGSGVEVMNIGATLNVGASQPAGTYTGTYDVTVDYN